MKDDCLFGIWLSVVVLLWVSVAIWLITTYWAFGANQTLGYLMTFAGLGYLNGLSRGVLLLRRFLLKHGMTAL